MFKRLRTRLTVLYAALFGVVLVGVSLAVFLAINGAAQVQVRNELAASGTVFDRLWSLRSERLREGADLLSRDFGFREAVATGDQATIASAMDNLRRRFGIDHVFMVGVDGHLVGEAAGLEGDAAKLQAAFDQADDPSGVVTLNGLPHQVVSAPVLSPDLIGWVVFAVRLDRREMSSLEKMSAIPLQAAVLQRTASGWSGGEAATLRDTIRRDAFIDRALKRRDAAPQMLDQGEGRAVALAKPLPTLMQDRSAVLLLRYPLALALAPYRPLLAVVGLAGLLGLAVVGWGSFALARGLTRPISALDEAAQRLQRGEDGQVAIESQDEIGRLAASFNTMATEIRERERRITHLALHDEDTGLPNRRALERIVDDRPPGAGRQLYVAALGIQRFDHVRGAIGYALAADTVRLVGERLDGLAPGSGVARIATDALGFTLAADSPEAAEAQAAALMGPMEAPLKVGGEAIDVALNMGLAPVDGAGRAGRAMELANIALDQARAARRKVGFFDAEAYGDPASNLSLMSGMLQALESGEIALHYQPKLDMRLSRITGAEALVRWRHPTRGMLSPDLFIPMAEETGHIRALTDWVLRQAVADQRLFAQAGHDLSIAVNISGRILGEPDFAPIAVEQAKAACGKLCFEITETAVIENPDLALMMLDGFADAGIDISIDDFGTGLSSLAYLKRIRGHELKIDKSIIRGVSDSQRDTLIVRSAIDLAHSLGLKVTAEGVETEAVYALLAGMGCDRAQGWLIARPLAVNDLLTFMPNDDRRKRSSA